MNIVTYFDFMDAVDIVDSLEYFLENPDAPIICESNKSHRLSAIWCKATVSMPENVTRLTLFDLSAQVKTKREKDELLIVWELANSLSFKNFCQDERPGDCYPS